jgi:type II secretory ATPase GspE/PulE/Tfp pilus assembly ATPase PilB-like protein
VLVGEIRDGETAGIAVQASLTGHLVFSTLHTNDAPSAATRLIDMGVEPYLVASSVEMVVAQRLVRLICPKCRTVDASADADRFRAALGVSAADAELREATLYRGTGCRNCHDSGYRGRQGVFELMPLSEEIRDLIVERAPSGRIRKIATQQGMDSLRGDGWRLVLQGRTTVEEVLRVTKDEAAGTKKATAVPAALG